MAQREGYDVELVRADMSKPLPFADESFDLIFHPVSNCYVKELQPIWNECYRVLKKGGILLAGWDNGINYLFEDDDEERVCCALPFDRSPTLRSMRLRSKMTGASSSPTPSRRSWTASCAQASP